jgi:hypothetical protein
MLTRETTEVIGTSMASPEELETVTALMAEEESAISDAPIYRPEAAGALLLGLLLSPKEPKERDRR